MDAQSPCPNNTVRTDDIVKIARESVSRRTLLKLGLTGATATALASLDALTWTPKRVALATSAATAFPDIQFDIANFIAPVQTFSGVQFQFGPILTVFLPATLNRLPSKGDQEVLANAFNTIESAFPFSPGGIFPFIAYGLPYFRKLPGGLFGRLVQSHMPHLLSNLSRYALEEAIPGPNEPYSERVQYLFRSDPIPSPGNTDQFANGGGASFLANDASVFLKYKK